VPRQIADVKDTEENDLDWLTASWTRSMTAERKSPLTVRSYLAGVSGLARWCETQGRPVELDGQTVEDWTLALLEAGRTANTVIARQRAVRRFSAWLARKQIISADRLRDVKPPKLDEPIVPGLTDTQLRALLATCRPGAFHDVRDRALILFLAETGTRAAEVIAMELPDLNLAAGVAIVRRGKGGKGRVVPFSPQCAEAIDDYLRLRKRHRLAKAGSTALWLGARGRTFGYDGLYHAISRRGEAAGLGEIHPHMLRHTAAIRWLGKGGSPLRRGSWPSPAGAASTCCAVTSRLPRGSLRRRKHTGSTSAICDHNFSDGTSAVIWYVPIRPNAP
jgi:integrase/recombinase XerD